VKNVAGEALGMDADEGRVARDVAHFEDDAFFDDPTGVAFKTVDAKGSEAAGKIGFSDLTEFKGRGHGG
jgi:hypothetical protein